MEHELTIGPLPMRRWYFAPPIVLMLGAGASLASSIHAFCTEHATHPLFGSANFFLMAVGASFVWILLLRQSRRRAIRVRITPDTIRHEDQNGFGGTIERVRGDEIVRVARVPQVVVVLPRWCIAYGTQEPPALIAGFVTFDRAELEPIAAEVREMLAKRS